jgi:hypothetical protein
VPTPRSPRDSGEKDIAAAEVHTAMNKLRIVAIGGFGWEIAHTAATRRPPISLHTMVPVPGATRTTLGFGIRPSFKGHSLSPRTKT